MFAEISVKLQTKLETIPGSVHRGCGSTRLVNIITTKNTYIHAIATEIRIGTVRVNVVNDGLVKCKKL